VKVTGFRELFQINRPVRTQAEGGDGHGAPGYEQQQQKQRQSDPNQESAAEDLSLKGMNPEQERVKLERAVEDFQKEAQTQQHGLSASISSCGSIPGLKVVLSDVNGNVIRQFEAAEFVRLRQSGVRDSRGRGKLLDQKF
jgi:hypothetical protein